jgi:hypothetical protein
MAVQYSVAVRDAMLNSIESTIGTSARLLFYTGTQPANCATASSGTLIATMVLPSDWMNAASSGTKTLLGTWSVVASNSGTAGYYRIFDSTVTTCHEQGSVGTSGTDIVLDNNIINAGQTITITAKTITAGNA